VFRRFPQALGQTCKSRKSRRGQVPIFPILVLAGISDIVLAGALWYFISDGSMILNIIFAALALSGVGLAGFGVIKTISSV